MLTIRKVENGYIINARDDEGENVTAVFQSDNENSKQQIENLREMFYTIKELLGESGSKHNEYNLEFNISMGENHPNYNVKEDLKDKLYWIDEGTLNKIVKILEKDYT